MKEHYLKPVFEPRSIALIGASERENSVARQVLKNIISCGFKGEVRPVNPKNEKVQGLRCYPPAHAIERPLDLAIYALPAASQGYVQTPASDRCSGSQTPDLRSHYSSGTF